MRSKKFIILIFIACITAITLILYFFYARHSHEIVTLQPEEGETKVKPENPGGIVIPNSDSLVYNKLYSADVKKTQTYILHNTEDPVELKRSKEDQTQYLDSIDEILANIENYENEAPNNSSINSSVDNNEDYVMPNNLKNLAQKQELVTDNRDTQDKLVSSFNNGLKIIKSEDERYRSMQINVVSKSEDGYKIQLSSAYSLADARKQWLAIKTKHAKILGNANLITKKVSGKNERIFYLVMAGTYPSLSNAKLVCRKLSFKKQSCIITK